MVCEKTLENLFCDKMNIKAFLQRAPLSLKKQNVDQGELSVLTSIAQISLMIMTHILWLWFDVSVVPTPNNTKQGKTQTNHCHRSAC